jgi:hypothetical protein
MDVVVFYIDKETNNFKSYHVAKNMNLDKVAVAVENYNKRENSKDRAEIVSDQHVIDAILRKDSIDTIKGYAEEFRETIQQHRNETDYLYSRIAQYIESVLDYIKENHAPSSAV